MPADRLCASFFTDLHAQGPEGVFTPAPVADVFAAIDSLAPKPATG